MNWELWSREQAAQILSLRAQIKVLRRQLRNQHLRADAWRHRALTNADRDRRRWYGR